jgi:hypothetical protein
VPTTFLGLVFFVTLVAPGVCYLVRKERRRGERKLSALREIATVVLVGFVCDVFVISALILLRGLTPGLAPDLVRFVQSPAEYSTQHPALIWWWSLALLAVACLIGFILGGFDIEGLGDEEEESDKASLGRRLSSRLGMGIGSVQFVSAWDKFLTAHGSDVQCSIVLDDDTWLGGTVLWFNTDLDESPNRDLVLVKPVLYRGPDETIPQELPDDYVMVSAGRIQYVGITHIVDVPDDQGSG